MPELTIDVTHCDKSQIYTSCIQCEQLALLLLLYEQMDMLLYMDIAMDSTAKS